MIKNYLSLPLHQVNKLISQFNLFQLKQQNFKEYNYKMLF